MLMPVTNAIGAAYTVAWNVAVQVKGIRTCLSLDTKFQVYSALIGQYIVSNPNFFLSLMSFTVFCCIVNFAIANILAAMLNKNKKK